MLSMLSGTGGRKDIHGQRNRERARGFLLKRSSSSSITSQFSTTLPPLPHQKASAIGKELGLACFILPLHGPFVENLGCNPLTVRTFLAPLPGRVPVPRWRRNAALL